MSEAQIIPFSKTVKAPMDREVELAATNLLLAISRAKPDMALDGEGTMQAEITIGANLADGCVGTTGVIVKTWARSVD